MDDVRLRCLWLKLWLKVGNRRSSSRGRHNTDALVY